MLVIQTTHPSQGCHRHLKNDSEGSDLNAAPSMLGQPVCLEDDAVALKAAPPTLTRYAYHVDNTFVSRTMLLSQ
jgi:hypothetical protein